MGNKQYDLYPTKRRIDEALSKLEKLPLFGSLPLFPWERFSSRLSSHFGIPSLALTPVASKWRKGAHLLAGLGKNPLILPFAISLAEGVGAFVMSEEDVAKVTSWLLSGSAKKREVSSDALREGFARFLALSALDLLQEEISLTVSLSDEEVKGPSFAIDIEISLQGKKAFGRLLLSEEVIASLRLFFGKQPTAKALPPGIELPIHILAGSVTLSREEIEALKKGDFIFLDTSVKLLAVGEIPLFSLQWHTNTCKLLPLQEEASMPSLGQIPLEIRVELTRFTLPLNKVLELSPGNTLELPDRPGDTGVLLLCNGRTIGRGELVEIGEGVGIRLLELNLHPEQEN